MNLFSKYLLLTLLFLASLFSVAAQAKTIAYLADNDNRIAVIDTSNQRFIQWVTGKLGSGFETRMALTPDQKHLYVIQTLAYHQPVSIVDTKTNQKIGEVSGLPDELAFSISLTPDGKKGYVTYEGKAAVFDVATNKMTKIIEGINPKLNAYVSAVRPDNQQAIIFSMPLEQYADTYIAYVDNTDRVVAQQKIYRFPVGSPKQVTITPDSQKMYIGIGDVGPLMALNLNTHEMTAISNLAGHSVFLSSDGKKAYLAERRNFNSYLHIFETATDKRLATIDLPVNSDMVVPSPDNTFAYVTTNPGDVVRVYDLTTLKETTTLNVSLTNVSSIVFANTP